MPGLNIFIVGIQMNNNNDFFHNNSLFLISNGLRERSKEEFDAAVNKRRNFLSEELLEEELEDGLKYNLDYTLNSDNFRSDEFVREHQGDHIVFAGCSNTFGAGVEYKKTWSYKLYETIKKDIGIDGYYNLGLCGGSIFEILININKYIKSHGFPKIIFILLPEIERDAIYFKEPEKSLTPIITELYRHLEFLCKSNGTKLISTSWVVDDKKNVVDSLLHGANKEYFNVDVYNHQLTAEGKFGDTGLYSNFKERYPFEQLAYLERYTATFKLMDIYKIQEYVYEFATNNPNDPYLFIAPDKNKHHGNAFHYAWYKYFYERYLNEKNNT
jgi:hypothetical protein